MTDALMPSPPYPCPVPDGWVDAPFDQLPRGWQKRVLEFIEHQDQPSLPSKP